MSTRGRHCATLAILLLMTGCSVGSPNADAPSPSPSTSPTTSPPSVTASPAAVPPAPPRAGCYRLTSRQLTEPTNDTAPVPCTSRHTSQTILVGRLDTVVDGHAVAVDSTLVQRQLASRCPRALASYVGGTLEARRLSRFNVVWYSPTLAQSDEGADWFRCDLIAFAGADQLFPLPGTRRLAGVLDRPRALDDYGLCGTSAPGARGFERVICGRRHSWRAIETIGLRGGSRYPGTAAVRRAGDSDCKDIAQARADDTLKFRYGWEWPTQAQWARGQHYGYCWVPD